jgi:hypothetical protein
MEPKRLIPHLTFPHGRGENRIRELIQFSQDLLEISQWIGFKLSSRGWCYQLEGFRLIDKGQFNRIQNLINECRKSGYLPVDFVAEEEARKFACVHDPTEVSPNQYLRLELENLRRLERWYTPNYWEGERCYIQMLVEKVDLKTLFQPICERYHIPIATSKGWSSISQRAEIALRFKIAESRGQIPVLLYCGDHDPYGLAISDTLRNNLHEVAGAVQWSTRNLVIDRFGLNYDFIQENHLSWIENLITGSGKQPDRSNPIVSRYIEQYGERKVEANAIVVIPEIARNLCRSAIEGYLGTEVLSRFQAKEESVKATFDVLRDEIGLQDYILEALGALS